MDAVAQFGLNDQCGLLVNSSRGIIYASQGEEFELAAKHAAEELQLQMKKWLTKKGIV